MQVQYSLSLSSVFGLYQLLREISDADQCFTMSGAELVVYIELLEPFHLTQVPTAVENDAMREVRANLNSEVVGRTDKQWAETRYKAL